MASSPPRPVRAPDAYPGMVDKRNWRKTKIHRHSRYGCAWCGRQFADPVAVYAHIDERHSKRVPERYRPGGADHGGQARQTPPSRAVCSEPISAPLSPRQRSGRVIGLEPANCTVRTPEPQMTLAMDPELAA
jgi:hypothetical protein